MTTESMEDEIRVLAQIEVAAARREIEWIALRLAGIEKDRRHLNKREAELLADHHAAQVRLKQAMEALS
jgi:hypothetical protein